MLRLYINKMITNIRLKKIKLITLHFLILWFNRHFNPVVKEQIKKPKKIPIIIISFNQLFYLKQLVDFLLKRKYLNIIIIDNNSTYPPLLDYFEIIKEEVTIHKLNDNVGHLSFWKQEQLFKKYSQGYYVVSDADIVPLDSCPEDFLKAFRQLLDKAYDRTKVGFSLKLEDIPDTNPNKSNILKWESQFWKIKINEQVYKAEIDTTFALYRPNYRYRLKHFTKAWRTNYPIQSRHGGWYMDINNLTEEQIYYMKTSNTSASWQIDAQGKLINKAHKPLYEVD